MNALLRLILLVPLAYVAALFCAGVVLSIGLVGGNIDTDTAAMAIGLSIGLTLYGGMVSFIPAFVVIVLAEIFRWRSVFLYLAAGGIIGLLAAETTIAFDGLAFADNLRLLCIASGFVGGFVYWTIVGKFAGLGLTAERPA